MDLSLKSRQAIVEEAMLLAPPLTINGQALLEAQCLILSRRVSAQMSTLALNRAIITNHKRLIVKGLPDCYRVLAEVAKEIVQKQTQILKREENKSGLTVVSIPVCIKRAMLIVTKSEPKSLKRLCRDVFHKVKLGMTPEDIRAVVLERNGRAVEEGHLYYLPALTKAAEISIQRQQLLKEMNTESTVQLNQTAEDRIKELCSFMGVTESAHHQGIYQKIRSKCLEVVASAKVEIGTFRIEITPEMMKPITEEVWDTQPGVGVTTLQALKTTPRASVSTLIKSLQVLQRGWHGNNKQVATLAEKHQEEKNRLREEYEALERQNIRLQKTLDEVVLVIDNHATAAVSHAASTWVRVLDAVANAKRVTR